LKEDSSRKMEMDLIVAGNRMSGTTARKDPKAAGYRTISTNATGATKKNGATTQIAAAERRDFSNNRKAEMI